jgi:hypothetical protein
LHTADFVTAAAKLGSGLALHVVGVLAQFVPDGQAVQATASETSRWRNAALQTLGDPDLDDRLAVHPKAPRLPVVRPAFDDGEDVTSQLDMSAARRPGLEQRRVNVDFPAWMIESLDLSAQGTPRGAASW